MKKWLVLGVLGTAVAAAAGLSSRQEVAPKVPEPTDAEVAAHVDARLHQVMHGILAIEHSDTLTATAHR
jgi:hypothetical protein